MTLFSAVATFFHSVFTPFFVLVLRDGLLEVSDAYPVAMEEIRANARFLSGGFGNSSASSFSISGHGYFSKPALRMVNNCSLRTAFSLNVFSRHCFAPYSVDS